MFASFSRARLVQRAVGFAGFAALALLSPPSAGASPLARPIADLHASRDEVAVIGIVRDIDGEPLSNVQVVVSGLNRVALTDGRGEFIIRGLPAGTYHLDFVRIGYTAGHQVVAVPASGDDVRVTVSMHVTTIRLSSVNVTATPTGTDPLNVTQATAQLSGRELQRNLTSSIGQTLANEPGMATRFNGPLASAPVIRGLSGERVLVLQDGERAGDLSAAAGDHLNAVDPSTAERIEVIRGPASLLYGNNALGGVINVISNDIPSTIPTRRSGFVLGQGESVTPGGVMAVGLVVPIGERFAVTARGGFRKFENLRVGGGAIQDNTSGGTDHATVGAGYVGQRVSVGAVYRQMNFEYGLPHQVDAEPIRLDGQRRTLAVQSSIGSPWASLSSVKIDGTSQWYSHSEIEPTGDVGTQFELATQTFNAVARTEFGRTKGAFGVQGLFRQYTPTGDEAFTPSADNNNVAVFAFQELPISRGASEEHSPRIQLGARLDRFVIATNPSNSEERDRFGAAQSRTYQNLAASVGLSVPVAPDVSFTSNVTRGFRAPAVEELFANGFHAAVGTFDIGNPELVPERSTGFEVGLRSQSSRTFAQANSYYNLIDRYIRPVAVRTIAGDEGNIPVVEFRQADAALYGIEGQIETKLPHHFVGGVMGDITRAKLRDGSENLPYIPAGRVGGSLRLDNGRWSAGGDVRRVFAQSNVSGDALDIATSAYTLLNVNVSWLVSARGGTVHSLNLRADNVLDTQYRDAASRIKSFAYNPGRNVSVVYKLLY